MQLQKVSVEKAVSRENLLKNKCISTTNCLQQSPMTDDDFSTFVAKMAALMATLLT